jgi:hypothetical protein
MQNDGDFVDATLLYLGTNWQITVKGILGVVCADIK